MRQNGGWVELVEPESRYVRARARLIVDGFAMLGGWRGALESVRVRPAGAGLPPGTYLAFSSGDAYPVSVELSGPQARVRCDAGLPTVIRELSEGE